MLFYFVCLLSFTYVYAGSICPARERIYPCICFDQQIGLKPKYDTTVICQGLTYGESLKNIESVLSSMDTDQFLLYDSYWPSRSTLLQQQENSRIPVNYLSTFRMTEVIVVDTALSSFACPQTDNCRTNYVKRFTAINTTVTDNPSCKNHFSINSWISCPETIESVVIDGGYTSEISLKPDFFPGRLMKLKKLRMPNNKISKIERRTFDDTKFPVLEILDLSHNFLRDVKILFSSALKLKYLDLSFNSISVAQLDLKYLPDLQFLNLTNNQITTLLQNPWTNMPANLRTIDLTKNELTCNCAAKWVNSTFHINTNLLGNCVSPDEVKGMKIRRASRLVNERCDEKNTILASKIKRA